jgi:large subunit ribosomal protein L1
MVKRGKKYVDMAKKATKTILPLAEAIKAAKKNSYSKFVGTMNLHVIINVPKDKEARSLKGSLALPFPIEKKIRIAVFTTPENAQAARDAGADKVGLEDLIKEIKAGTMDFDIAIATADVMPKIAILGKELGPKGLMPSPKNGTVTTDVAATVAEYKKGKLNFVCDQSGVFHLVIGKANFDDANIVENVKACVAKIVEIVGKSVTATVKAVYVAPTMGKSVQVTNDSITTV